MKFDGIDAKIIHMLQGDIPLKAHPFEELAKQLGISEAEVVERIRYLQDEGMMRRWGAVLRHQQAGYRANAMVAWRVDEARADEYGTKMAAMKEISHCYLRQVPDEFPYEMFTMVHARNELELSETINKIAEVTGLTEYIVLKSVREFKKVSMQYV